MWDVLKPQHILKKKISEQDNILKFTAHFSACGVLIFQLKMYNVGRKKLPQKPESQ